MESQLWEHRDKWTPGTPLPEVLVGKTPISRNKRLGVGVPFIPALWRQREENLREFKSGLKVPGQPELHTRERLYLKKTKKQNKKISPNNFISI